MAACCARSSTKASPIRRSTRSRCSRSSRRSPAWIAQDPELAETFTWRVFAGLTAAQIAELRGVTERTVQRDLALARNYLRLALGGET